MTIAPAIRARIGATLAELERCENIRILFAVESGSRAWGFPSPDSDYDVRFVYVRPLEWYLSLTPGRDVIERPISDALDVAGWDLRKALGLLIKANPALLEWLSSPIVYRATPEAEGLAMRPGPRPRIKVLVLEDLSEAIKACRKVRIQYRNRRTRQVKERLVHPYGFLHGHRHYLVGWHENPKANDVALFSLPNIESVELAEETFVRNPDFDLQAFAARSFGLFQGEEPFETVWRFAPEAAADAADFVFHPNQVLEPQPDGALVVRFTATGDLEMAWHLYAWGDKVEVLEPRRLADMVHGRRVAWPALP